jgi:hypothetical protein
MIKIENETYIPSKDDDGKEYFCPTDVAGSDGRVSGADTEVCLEADVTGRYASVDNQ